MKRTIIGIFTIATVLYAILTIMFALDGYPVFRQDAICFLPTSYLINHQHQLINPLYDAGVDPLQHRFLFYPPLFPYIVALICKILPDNYTAIHVALTLIDICSITITLICAYTYIKKNIVKPDFLLYPFLIIWVIALFSFYGVFEGRPETLTNFFIACFILNNIYKKRLFSDFVSGVIVGLNAITSPISTFYLSIIIIGTLFYRKDFNIKSVAVTIIGFVLVMSCFALLYPYHLIDLFNGLLKHSSNVVVNRAVSGSDTLKWIRDIYFITPFHALAGVSFLISIFYSLYLLVKQKNVAAILCFILLLALIYYFAFKNVMMSYNMYVLSPIYMFLLFVFFVDILNKKILAKFVNTSFWFLLILLFINSLGLFRTAMVFFSTQDKKSTINNLSKEIEVLSRKLQKNKKIYVTFSLWPACLDKANSVTSFTSTENPIIQYIVFQQSNSGQTTAPKISGFKLIKDGFIPAHPMMFGKIKIGNTYPYYQTAIYEKE